MMISPLRTLSNIKKSKYGFTLVELLVVIALLAIITAISLPRVAGVFRVSLKNTSREMASTIRDAYHSTLLTQKIHRIAYDLDKNQYWVESAPKGTLLMKPKEDQRFENEERQNQRNKSFSQATSVTEEKQSLDGDATLKAIYNENAPEKGVQQGKTYSHFFPDGLTESTLIHLEDSQGNKVTLVISSILGKTKILSKHIKPQEYFGS